MELKDMPFWGDKRTFSKFEAYLDYSDRIKRKESFTIRELADHWRWDKSKVNRFCEFLKSNIFNKSETRSETNSETRKPSKIEGLKIVDETKSETINETENVGRKMKKPPKEKSINTKARDVFMDHFQEVFSEAYYWSKKDAGCMTQLIRKLSHSREARKLPVDDDSVLNALKVFLEKIKDKWVLENFSVPIINSKYNELVSQAKEAFQKGMDVGIKLESNPNKYDKSKLW